MHIDSIPGQLGVKSYFKKLVTSNRIPHAIMLFGNEGHGKLSLARSFAKLLQCHNNAEGIACNSCPSCLKADKNIHPDIHFSFPVIKKDNLKREDTTAKNFLTEWREFLVEYPFGNITDWMQHLGAIDKRPNINVAECNEIIKNLGLKTYEGLYKIQIIWQADFLGKEGNRLLKLIEEPADNTIIILIIDNRNAILNTIKSRCQSLLIPPFEDEVIEAYITDNSNLKGEDQKELTYLSNGNMRIVIKHLNENQLNYSEDLLKWLRCAYKLDPEEIISFNDQLKDSGKQDIINFFSYGLHFLRQLNKGLNAESQDSLKLTKEEKEVAEKLQKLINIDKIAALEAIFSKSIGHIKRNLSIKVLLMSMTFEINAILKAEVNKFVTN